MNLNGYWYNPLKVFKISEIQEHIQEDTDALGNVLSKKPYYKFTIYFDIFDTHGNREQLHYERYDKALVYQTLERIKNEIVGLKC
ncbi:hypothetical protein [Emticicia sp. W12TSBA100-4]|uniref:hypothetical protein n=1 Tax=Emticicia sp. W12TSBA100-4 TaxID=3160965 RepID=UPI003305B8B9